MGNPLFTRKPIQRILDEMAGDNRLHRVLGPVSLSSLGVGAIIGTGIFVLTGVAAHDKAGPALMLSYAFAGLACIFAALCYSEFAAMVPVAGSAYTYAYATLGELAAWMIGWDLILEYAVGNVAVAISWGDYFNTLLRGTGWVALTTDGPPVVLNAAEAPTFADTDAIVAWSAHLQTQLVSSMKASALIGRGSGEAVQVAFSGPGFVIVQPSEGITVGAVAAH